MKKLFLSLVALTMAAMSYAQSSLLATLSHEGEISTYYGATALRDAYNAATHGDIITLSSGSFTPVDIKKALTIRGAGMQVDTIAKTYPTIISGDFSINIPSDTEQRLTLEGLYNNFTIKVEGTLKNASFLKNRFYLLLPKDTNVKMQNLTFIHCKITKSLGLPPESSASCVNSYIKCALSVNATSSNFEFTNCFINNVYDRISSIGSSYYDVRLNSIGSSSFYNCIICSNGETINSSCSALYCVGTSVSSNVNIFKNIPQTTNTAFTGLNTLFKTYDNDYNDSETFELTEEAKTKYKGADGTEVGLYGGSLPYDPTPTNPQITKCNVASKSTADGKLSVEIEVSATE